MSIPRKSLQLQMQKEPKEALVALLLQGAVLAVRRPLPPQTRTLEQARERAAAKVTRKGKAKRKIPCATSVGSRKENTLMGNFARSQRKEAPLRLPRQARGPREGWFPRIAQA